MFGVGVVGGFAAAAGGKRGFAVVPGMPGAYPKGLVMLLVLTGGSGFSGLNASEPTFFMDFGVVVGMGAGIHGDVGRGLAGGGAKEIGGRLADPPSLERFVLPGSQETAMV